MPAPIPSTEPASLIAGDTAKWTRSLADYSAADAWVLSYELVNASNRYKVTASASGADHLVTVSATTTANWLPGSYTWRARVSKAGEVYTVGEGAITVAPSFASAIEARSSSRIALENVEAYIRDPANLQAGMYTINGRQLQRHSWDQVLRLRSQLKAEVAREDAALAAKAGLPDKRRALVAFRRV